MAWAIEMNRLKTFLKWGALSVCALVLILAVAGVVSRTMYPTEAQRIAIQEMKQLPERSGENAFALLWTLNRAVPDDQLDEVMAEDSSSAADGSLRYASSKENGVVTGSTERNSAAEMYPDLSPSNEDRALFCDRSDQNCLSKVRDDPEAYAALVERNHALLDRAERLNAFDHIRTPFPRRMGLPIPRFQPLSLLRTQRALTFAQGREREAIANVCRDIQTWRRLGKESDNLNARMVLISYTTTVIDSTLVHMLAEWPIDRALPEPCASALAPPTVEDVSICNAMRTEFAYTAHAISEMQAEAESRGMHGQIFAALIFDAEATLGASAEAYQSTCSQSERLRLAADEPVLTIPKAANISRFACLGNAPGCILIKLAWPTYQSYRLRLQDYGAKLRVLGTLAWMRRNARDGRSPADLLAARPDDLKSPEREIEFGTGGQTLQVRLYEPNCNDNNWSIPLPTALHAAQDRD